MEAYAVEGNLTPFAELVAGLVDKQLDRYLEMEKHAQGMNQEPNM